MSRPYREKARLRVLGDREWREVSIVAYSSQHGDYGNAIVVSAPFLPPKGAKQFQLDGKPALHLRRDRHGTWGDMLTQFRYELEAL